MAGMLLTTGEPAPHFVTASTSNPKYHFDTVAGRYVVLCFFQSAGTEAAQQILRDLRQHRQLFDDERHCFFGISLDPEDQAQGRVDEQIPGIRFLWDFDQKVSRQFGLIDNAGTYSPCTYILDERLRVLTVIPLENQVESHFEQIVAFLADLPKLPEGRAVVQAPVLVVPRIFSPDLCQALIDYYDRHGGEESGFMREVQGRTVHVLDHGFKRRQDQEIVDEELRTTAMYRIHDCLVPEIARAFQFHVTRIERHIVACYDATSGGFFRPHRDNTTKGTAHRRFAVSLNLNTGDYEGGMLRFPEFGQYTYEAPAGGAVVFSCSLLHEATPVTQGRRYAYLPFLYDDAAAAIREKNRHLIGEADPAEAKGSASTQSNASQTKGFQPSVGASRSSKKKRR